MARRKAAGRSGRSKKATAKVTATVRRMGRGGAARSGARAVKRGARRRKPGGKPASRAAKVTAKGSPKPAGRKVPPARARAARPRTAAKTPVARTPVRPKGKVSRVDRQRRTLEDVIPTPPSSLNMDRRGSAVRTGRAEMAQTRENLGRMGALTGGDVDADAENAYFSGDEAPGGDNPTPDQDIVDDIGRALGVEYQDAEELRPADKLIERDRHRWELDPASSEDYKERK